MEIEQSEAKLIIYRLDKVDETLQVIVTKLDEINATNGKQNMDINGLGIKTQSIQFKLAEHKSDHKYNTGIILTVAGLIGGIMAFVISFIRGK